MIAVNIRTSGAAAVTEQQVREAAAGNWVMGDASLRQFGDYLLAVRKNVVLGVWAIEGHDRVAEDNDRVRFALAPAPEHADLIGEQSPVEWARGQANPVKLLATDTMRPESREIELTQQGNRRVELDGWSMIVYPDGRARVQPKANGGRKLIVESAFPGPDGGNVTVRLIDA